MEKTKNEHCTCDDCSARTKTDSESYRFLYAVVIVVEEFYDRRREVDIICRLCLELDGSEEKLVTCFRSIRFGRASDTDLTRQKLNREVE